MLLPSVRDSILSANRLTSCARRNFPVALLPGNAALQSAGDLKLAKAGNASLSGLQLRHDSSTITPSKPCRGLCSLMQHSSLRTNPVRAWQWVRREFAEGRSGLKAADLHERRVPRRLVYALAVVCALLLAGCGRPATTASGWIDQQAARNKVPSLAAFSPVPATTLDGARSTGDCNVDKINGQTAQGMALDHLGEAAFTGWAGDHLTHAVPAAVAAVLEGASGDYWASGKSGSARPDVANAQKVPAYATSGFGVGATMYRVPIGEYGIFLAYRIGTQWVECRTNVRVSVE